MPSWEVVELKRPRTPHYDDPVAVGRRLHEAREAAEAAGDRNELVKAYRALARGATHAAKARPAA